MNLTLLRYCGRGEAKEEEREQLIQSRIPWFQTTDNRQDTTDNGQQTTDISTNNWYLMQTNKLFYRLYSMIALILSTIEQANEKQLIANKQTPHNKTVTYSTM